jgi:hypothetical protein
MSLVRVMRTAAATLTRTVYVDETPTDMAAPPAVTVTRLDGTVVVSGTATKPGSTTGIYTYTLPGGPTSPGSATWQLDHLDVTWAGSLAGAAVTMVDRVEVVGGFLFGLAEARASDPSLASQTTYPTAALAAARVLVEQECELICRQAFVPRFRRYVTNGTGLRALQLPDPHLRVLRAAKVAWVTGQPLVALGAGDLANTVVTDEGVAVRGYNIWPFGTGNVLFEYEYGPDQPPEDLRQAAMARLRYRLNTNRSGLPSNVSSYTTQEGTFRVMQPGARRTGDPEVDAVYQRYSEPLVGTG